MGTSHSQDCGRHRNSLGGAGELLPSFMIKLEDMCKKELFKGYETSLLMFVVVSPAWCVYGFVLPSCPFNSLFSTHTCNVGLDVDFFIVSECIAYFSPLFLFVARL